MEYKGYAICMQVQWLQVYVRERTNERKKENISLLGNKTCANEKG